MAKNNLVVTCGFVFLFGGLMSAAGVQTDGRSRQPVPPKVTSRAAEMSSRLARLEKIVGRLRSSHLRFRTDQDTAAWEELLSKTAKDIEASSRSLAARPFIDPETFKELADSVARLGALVGVKAETRAGANRGSRDQAIEASKRQKQQEMSDNVASESKQAVDSVKEQLRMALRILKETEERQSQNIAAISRI